VLAAAAVASALVGLLLVTAARLIDWQRLFYSLRASRFDTGLVLATAFAAVFIIVAFSILIGVALSIFLCVSRAAGLKATELVVKLERVIRARRPTDPRCNVMVLLDWGLIAVFLARIHVGASHAWHAK